MNGPGRNSWQWERPAARFLAHQPNLYGVLERQHGTRTRFWFSSLSWEQNLGDVIEVPSWKRLVCYYTLAPSMKLWHRVRRRIFSIPSLWRRCSFNGSFSTLKWLYKLRSTRKMRKNCSQGNRRACYIWCTGNKNSWTAYIALHYNLPKFSLRKK